MASIFFPKEVVLACSCGSLQPITLLYFCKHCVNLKCSNCVFREIDSNYCSSCMENLAISEAKGKKNRCGSCFSCPSCFHCLSVKATSAQNPKSAPSKMNTSKNANKSYYLTCYFCLWSSRDIEMEDQNTATGINDYWLRRIDPFAGKLAQLNEYYQLLTVKERLDREKRTTSHKQQYYHFLEKSGITKSLALKKAGLPAQNISRHLELVTEIPKIEKSIASEAVEELPPDIFTKEVNILAIPSMTQRLAMPDIQPEIFSDAIPNHKRLFIKTSLRCRSCVRYICKPEYSPASTKFKINMSAYYHVPDIRVMESVAFFRDSKPVEVFIKITNPTQNSTFITFAQLSEWVEESVDDKSLVVSDVLDVNSMLMPKVTPVEKRKVDFAINGSVDLPNKQILLPAKSDVADFEDRADPNLYEDDSNAVTWKKGHKVIVRLLVAPKDDLKGGDLVRIGFILSYVFRTKTIPAVEGKMESANDVNVRYFLTVGQMKQDSLA